MMEGVIGRHVRWIEEHVRGRERYYLVNKNGDRELVIIGREKERNNNNMIYSFVRERERGKEILKSKREVVDWLNSMVKGSAHQVSQTPLAEDACKLELETLKDNQTRKPSHFPSESVWVGTPWTCKKRRRHYPAYLRSGVRISVNDFVFVLAEENKRLVAFLDDMYEDSRGSKMVVVRWFHKIDEVGITLPHDYNDKEIYFSLCLQDLSIECIDGLATVLSPQHFEKFLSDAQLARFEVFVCQSLFDNDEVTPFDITQIKGYWKQAIVKQCTGTALPPKVHVNSSSSEGVVTRPKKRLRRLIESDHGYTNLAVPKVDMDVCKKNFPDASVSFKLEKVPKLIDYLSIGSQVEVLSQDSGLRGCWFRAVIIKKHKNKVKVQYQDIKDAEDEAKNLQEWLPASKITVQDPLGLRLSGRRTIRPTMATEMEKVSLFLCPGTVVDVWLHDGWWEAIILQKENEDKVHVYFPGEKQNSTLPCKDMRLSKEWVGNKWVSLKGRPDLATKIRSDLNGKQDVEMKKFNHPKPEVDDVNKLVSDAPKDHSVMKDDVKPQVGVMYNKVKEMRADLDVSREDLFDRLKWKSSKRRTPCIVNKRKGSPDKMWTRVFDDYFGSDPLKVDQEICKYMGDCSFSSSVPSLTNLVMSR